eukprot:TRINITY_DN7746_c0_g1_i2.p1 TRINITY_DN7746_c0_g1~~TRINITY_DN7746_c0_g1_i2.p1  ORF type:complete len:243 (+),score=30.16 TRINITY_DN7746_c0_g1_i2:57-785(+)
MGCCKSKNREKDEREVRVDREDSTEKEDEGTLVGEAPVLVSNQASGKEQLSQDEDVDKEVSASTLPQMHVPPISPSQLKRILDNDTVNASTEADTSGTLHSQDLRTFSGKTTPNTNPLSVQGRKRTKDLELESGGSHPVLQDSSILSVPDAERCYDERKIRLRKWLDGKPVSPVLCHQTSSEMNPVLTFENVDKNRQILQKVAKSVFTKEQLDNSVQIPKNPTLVSDQEVDSNIANTSAKQR